jgi:hypothetical protein
MSSEEKLKTIGDLIKKGIAPPKETVRSFLLWFGASKRGYRVSRRIKGRLAVCRA